ncbi:MAG TPA: response regulator [Pyrinomonadaceae bacterium]|jgi:CheY-like chemotaxis protein|nr:response regulator [Pyrinomonadaceae bacterium]
MPQKSVSPTNAPAPNRGALILVVERNPVAQRLERYFLEHAGFSVEFTADGITALTRVQELRPAILVTEILVPKLDGLSLCQAIKSDPDTKEILVMIFSHLHAEDRAIEVGADAFLAKPVDEELLIGTVERLLSLRKVVGGNEP